MLFVTFKATASPDKLSSNSQPKYVTFGLGQTVDFNAGKTQLISFDWSNNTGAIDVKMNSSVLEEISSFKMLWLTFSSKL